MKTNVLLFPFVAVLTLMIVSFASAVTFTVDQVEIDGVVMNNSLAISGFAAGSIVPVRVWFYADEDQSNVEIEVEFQGYDETETVSQDFGFVEADTNYRSKIFNVRIPNDVSDASENTVLYVTVSSKEGEARESYALKLQRESYELDVLSVDYSSKISAGDVFPVSVVVKNSGYGFTEDNFVVVSIPALGISTRGYVGDLASSEDYSNDNHEDDAVQKTVYLKVPADAASGVYDMEVVVYNDDSKTITGSLVAIDGIMSEDASEDASDEVLEEETSASVIALTVVLVIIFVVLLAVLVVLLTKKEKPIEEVETSYY